MRSLLSLVVYIGFYSALAAPKNLEIDSKLFFDGKKIGAPRILAEYGAKSKVFMNDRDLQREFNLVVTPVRMKNNKLKLRYTLAIKESENEIISRGFIDMKDANKGRIYLDRGKVELHLDVKDT